MNIVSDFTLGLKRKEMPRKYTVGEATIPQDVSPGFFFKCFVMALHTYAGADQ